MKFSLKKFAAFIGTLIMLTGSFWIWYWAFVNKSTPTQDGDISLFWTLVVVGFLPAGVVIVYCAYNKNNFKKENFKYLFFYKEGEQRAVKLSSKDLKELARLNELESKAKQEAEYKNKEKTRKNIESHRSKLIGNWAFLPMLSAFVYGAVAIFYYYKYDQYHMLSIVIFGIIGLFVYWAVVISTEWENELRLKIELASEDKDYQIFDYDYDYVYTDKLWEIYIYKIGKVISYLSNIAALILIIILLFLWLGSISIAPTTIIIILLILLILRQR